MPDAFPDSGVGEPVSPCPSDDCPTLVKPAPDHVFLAGQTFAFEASPADATVKATGQTIEDGKILIGKAGITEVIASRDGKDSEPAFCKIVAPEVVAIEVLNTQPIDDAQGIQYERDLGADKHSHREVAAILIDEKLRLKIKLQGTDDITEPADVTIIGEADSGLVLKGQATIGALSGGMEVTVESEEVLSGKVQVNTPTIRWRLESELSKSNFDGPDTEMHIYSSFRPAIQNISTDRSPVSLKHHFEMACQWARGASKNIGKGADSIAHNIDNMMRHYVHTQDEKGDIWATCYPNGGDPPVNYKDLPNSWKASSGDRGVSSLYYPPLKPTKDYQEYHHFRDNFGWYLLDNETHTGGRCNQQAALVCAILGLFGIKASVHYLERRGRGKRTGRPCRQYFYAAGGSGPWNFHGIVRVELDEGEWLYDGSFSSPPNRLNGEREWAEKPGGPFIKEWHEPWTYEDMGGWSPVPEDDTPETWQGIQ